jgi:cytidine deaminase
MIPADDLIREARTSLLLAHAPYSGFRVGAVVVDEADRVFSGANVENASFGLTVCAERVAIFKAVSSGARSIRALAIVSEHQHPCWPCGACLQVMAEFAEDAPIYVEGPDRIQIVEQRLKNLLPVRFDPSAIQKAPYR